MASAVKLNQAAIKTQAISPGWAAALGDDDVLVVIACQAERLRENVSIEVRSRVP